MPRDPRKLRVFGLADDLVPEIYQATRSFPDEEKFGLVSQMRRAAVSIAANIAEGCGRRTTADYLRFLAIATGSAYELGYLCGLSGRLDMLKRAHASTLQSRCGAIAASLTALVDSLENADASEMRSSSDDKRTRARRSDRGTFQIALDELPSQRKRSRT